MQFSRVLRIMNNSTSSPNRHADGMVIRFFPSILWRNSPLKTGPWESSKEFWMEFDMKRFGPS